MSNISIKASYYNHIIPYKNDSHILFNAYTLATVIVSSDKVAEIAKFLKSPPDNADAALVQTLSKAGFLVPSDKDEKLAIRKRLQEARMAKSELNLTVAPTLGCNFNCPYCFESKSSRADFSKMSLQIQQQLVAFAKQFIHKNTSKLLNITWFGGEPLLAIKEIEHLSAEFIKLAIETEIQYGANIVTNGYKLTPNNIDILLKCKIFNAQITIDGSEHIHNERRILKNGKGTYQQIVNNIMTAVERGMNICIRINVDKNNFQDIDVLLAELDQYGLRKKIFVSLGYIADEYGKVEEAVQNLQAKEFANLEFKVAMASVENGANGAKIDLPKIIANYCSADSENAFMIGPKGELYQCWEDFGDQSKIVGNICFKMEGNENYVAEYMEFDPTVNPKCSQCNVMPLCMGGCPKQRLLHDNIPQCGVYKYNLADWITAYADGKVQEQTAVS